MAPKVSIIVPVYNSEKYLSKCLESLINQTYKNTEIIIVNDGSTDGSDKIVRKFLGENKNIKYYYQENSGPSEARNKGILNSTGEYIVFVDSDDTVEKNYVKSLLNKMLTSNADLVCCGYKDISYYGEVLHIDFKFESDITIDSLIQEICSGTGGVLWSKIYKKEIILKNNLKFDGNIYMSEDLIFVLRYAINCKSFATIKDYLYNYNRLNQMSITTNITIDYLQNYITVCKMLEKIFESAKIREQDIENILSKRVQDIVVNLVEKQSVNLKFIGWNKAVLNIKEILSSQYINKYKHNFTTKKGLYIPYLFFIKNSFFRTCLFYGTYLSFLKSLKKKLPQRKIGVS